MAELTKEQQLSIDNYGNRIKSLKDFVEAVRVRTTMYLGSIGNKGLLNCMREIWQNSIDTVLDQRSPGNWFSVHYDMITREVTVEDNGTGLPFNDIIRILTTQHTSKNYEKRLYEYSSGYNGVGAKIVNAVSEYFIVESYRYDGTAVRVEFKKGYPKTPEPKPIPNKEHKQGLKIRFKTDDDVMGITDLNWEIPYRLLKRMLSTMPIGSRCSFSAVDLNNVLHKEEIINKDGIITDLIMKTKMPIIKPIITAYDDGTHKLDCAFCYDGGDEEVSPMEDVNVTSFCNMCPTIGGTHVEGVVDGICKWFTNYMNNIYLANQKAKDKLKIISNDIKYGLNIMISAFHLEPQFHDQEKQLLGNEDMTAVCRQAMIATLDQWSKSNPQDLAKISKYFKEIAEMRIKQDKDKEKIVQKYATSTAVGGLPLKYKRPLNNDKNVELIIVEGDSATATAEVARDRKTQGILPIKGKMPNPFRRSKAAFFNNEEVQSINQIILRKPYTKNFDISEVHVSKIIFMADADVDGYHICSLLEKMFILYYPQLIEAGMVYRAVPPLYGINAGSKAKYFTEQKDMVKYVQRAFTSKYTLKDANNKALITNKEITDLLMVNEDYLFHINDLTSHFALYPGLLETFLYHYVSNKDSINISKLKKEISSKYRFMNAKMVNGVPVIDGTIDQCRSLIGNTQFIEECKPIINILHNNISLYYYIDDKKVTIYEIMKLYDSSYPRDVKRFKGLGEMEKEELAQSTIHPAMDRTLIRYTVDDIKETLNIIRDYDSDTKKILNLVGTVRREDLLD